MTFEFWSLLILALLAGAMSPGPSLALVVRTSMAYSRSEALVVALAHGAGVGLYALLVVIGLDQVVNRAPWTITALQLAGGMFLIYLGVTMALAAIAARQNVESPGDTEPLQIAGKPPDYSWHFTNGFLIVFLNPKVIILAHLIVLARPPNSTSTPSK